MRIVITAKDGGKGASFDPTFGRCAFFALFGTEKGYLESFENKASREAGGAGIAAVRIIGGLKADAIITGHLGPNATRAVKEMGTGVYYGHFKDIEEAFSKFQSKELQKVDLI